MRRLMQTIIAFAVHRLETLLEVFDDVPGHQRQPLLCADHRFELGPLGLELLLALDLLAFGRLLEAGVDLRALGIKERELGQPALVVDRHRSAVLHGALDVVNADVVAEHRARVGVLQLDRRAGKADERGVGKSVPHVPRESVDEVVLAAVRLVGDDDDVAPLGEHLHSCPSPTGGNGLGQGRIFSLALRERGRGRGRFREKLLNRGEDHATGSDLQLLAQIGAVGCLNWWLAQQLLTCGKRAEQLVVQIVAVGDHDDGGVVQRQHDLARVEHHG